jgi:guanylate kinase
MPELKTWLRENQVVVIGLIGQAIIALIYLVNLEARLTILETRGSPHLEEISTRLTIAEKEIEANNKSIERIKDVMTKDLHIAPTEFGSTK